MKEAVRKQYSHLGFDREDEKQERDLGAYLAELRHPGNTFVSFSRQRVRVARLRHKEGLWSSFKKEMADRARGGIFHNKIPIPVTPLDRADMETRAAQVELNMILDLLPYAVKQEAVMAMLEKSDRKISKVGKKIAEMRPELKNDA